MSSANTDGSVRILACWKEIAGYMGKGVRTVQRWELKFGLPVRRPPGVHRKSAVLAHTQDLDAWMELHWSKRKPEANQRQLSELNDLIKTARALRQAHRMLMDENSAALESLIESCNQLDDTRQNFGNCSRHPAFVTAMPDTPEPDRPTG
jgi:hypothetical protein